MVRDVAMRSINAMCTTHLSSWAVVQQDPKDVYPYTLDMPNTLIFPLEYHMDLRSSETYARENTCAPSRAHSMRVKK
ncbi:hypothetical protein TNCV_3299401 [Trichonephila clavipes]|uniref:Uncharacterized protein n=1 Tax=Trichonephila clavipes TaxID=2585209 RepID=A0A8X6VTS2_TRICX|nr:hypothetical protein TNCV_3299401 [Trichonephila clavipes]